jgi:DNA-nicking Smr family endonuclease
MTMNKDNLPDAQSFFEFVDDVKPLKQNTHHFRQEAKAKPVFEFKEQQLHADSYFSDSYQPLLPHEGPMRWIDDTADKLELKRLRRGDYQPDLLLDLHGLRQSEAKLELAALIQACIKQSIQCCSVMHGYGAGILKQQIPIWLVQHPNVKAFHQAPKEWGGDAALLVLIDLGDKPHRR